MDLAYTIFDGDTSTSDEGAPVNVTVAETLQGYLVKFAMWENPNGKGLPGFPVH